MNEPARPDRAADRYMYCVWVEDFTGGSFQVMPQFSSADAAREAADAMVDNDPDLSYSRVIVYDSMGLFTHMRVWRPPPRRPNTFA